MRCENVLVDSFETCKYQQRIIPLILLLNNVIKNICESFLTVVSNVCFMLVMKISHNYQ